MSPRALNSMIIMGLVITAAEFIWLGSEDVNGALTYAGRLNGALILLAATVALLAIAAYRDHISTQRQFRYSGIIVVVAILASLFVNVALLALQIEGRSYTIFLGLWLFLIAWALMVLIPLYQQYRNGQLEVPKPKAFAVGVLFTALITAANFGYAQIYQPYTTPASISTTIELGKADIKDKIVTVPVRLKLKNSGRVGVYVLGSLYQVTARKAIYTETYRKTADWLQDINDGQPSLLRYGHEREKSYQLLAQGRFVAQGRKLDPGAEVTTDSIVQFPQSKSYDAINVSSNMVYLRTDRAVLTGEDYARSGRSSWHKNKTPSKENSPPEWVSEEGIFTFKYQGRIIHSNAFLEYTRSPRHVTLWWVLEEPKESWNGPFLVATISQFGKEKDKPDPPSRQQLSDEYGLDEARSGRIQKTMQQLLN